MGLGKLNIWISDVGKPCDVLDRTTTEKDSWGVTIFNCKEILKWKCGRYLNSSGKWVSVPNGVYTHLPITCGHLEVELPPGCYWVVAANISASKSNMHFNYSTHIGIVIVNCDSVACVKLFNPSFQFCWDWFKYGFQMLEVANAVPKLDQAKFKDFAAYMEKEVFHQLTKTPLDETIEGFYKNMLDMARKQ